MKTVFTYDPMIIENPEEIIDIAKGCMDYINDFNTIENCLKIDISDKKYSKIYLICPKCQFNTQIPQYAGLMGIVEQNVFPNIIEIYNYHFLCRRCSKDVYNEYIKYIFNEIWQFDIDNIKIRNISYNHQQEFIDIYVNCDPIIFNNFSDRIIFNTLTDGLYEGNEMIHPKSVCHFNYRIYFGNYWYWFNPIKKINQYLNLYLQQENFPMSLCFEFKLKEIYNLVTNRNKFDKNNILDHNLDDIKKYNIHPNYLKYKSVIDEYILA